MQRRSEATDRRLWMVGDVPEVRAALADAAADRRTRVEALDWDEAEARRRREGCPDGVILTDRDLMVDLADALAYLAGCARILICCVPPLRGLDLSILDAPNVELLWLPFDPDEFGEALAWLHGESVEPDWAGSKNALQMTVP